MPKWLIVVFVFLILVLVGVNGYLFYSYFAFKALPTPTPTPTNVSLTGEIKPGWQLPQEQNYCSNSYYIVADTGIFEVQLSDQLKTSPDQGFASYKNLTLSLSGTTSKANNTSCADFISVNNLTATTTTPNQFEIQGKVSCLPNTDPNNCVKVFQNGNYYIALEGITSDLTSFQVGDNIDVIGSSDDTFDFAGNPDITAAILTTSVTKTQ